MIRSVFIVLEGLEELASGSSSIKVSSLSTSDLASSFNEARSSRVSGTVPSSVTVSLRSHYTLGDTYLMDVGL